MMSNKMMKHLNCEALPNGTNVIVAIGITGIQSRRFNYI